MILDIGGEGRYPGAWNLNPRPLRSIGPQHGQPIPRLIQGRGDAIPLPDSSVDVIIVERTPLRVATVAEMQRIAKPNATIILRHAWPWPHRHDPHRLVLQSLAGTVKRTIRTLGKQTVQQTIIRLQSCFQAELWNEGSLLMNFRDG